MGDAHTAPPIPNQLDPRVLDSLNRTRFVQQLRQKAILNNAIINNGEINQELFNNGGNPNAPFPILGKPTQKLFPSRVGPYLPFSSSLQQYHNSTFCLIGLLTGNYLPSSFEDRCI